MANIYARLKNQNKFRYQIVFSARIDRQDEDDQVLDEIELSISFENYSKINEIRY